MPPEPINMASSNAGSPVSIDNSNLEGRSSATSAENECDSVPATSKAKTAPKKRTNSTFAKTNIDLATAKNKNKILESGLTASLKELEDKKDAEKAEAINAKDLETNVKDLETNAKDLEIKGKDKQLEDMKEKIGKVEGEKIDMSERLIRINVHHGEVLCGKKEQIQLLEAEIQNAVEDHGNRLQMSKDGKSKEVTLARVLAEYDSQLKATKAENANLKTEGRKSQQSVQNISEAKENFSKQLENTKGEADKIRGCHDGVQVKLKETERQVKGLTDQKNNLESAALEHEKQLQALKFKGNDLQMDAKHYPHSFEAKERRIEWLGMRLQPFLACSKADQENYPEDGEEQGLVIKRVADTNIDQRPQKQARIEDHTFLRLPLQWQHRSHLLLKL